MIKVNLEKAQQIWKDKWREARKPLLEKLDVEFMKALELGDTSKIEEIKIKKQALRDITNEDLSGLSPDQIKSIWPDALK